MNDNITTKIAKKKLCNRRFEEIKDFFDWKQIPNCSHYVINKYGDIYNQTTGQCIRTTGQIKKGNVVQVVNDEGNIHQLSYKKTIRELFGLGYFTQEQILVEKYPTYLLAESLRYGRYIV
jgi:hypothetical protein